MRAALIALGMALVALGADAAAREPRAAPQVGLPGCADDVAVRASRESITFGSRLRPIRAHLYTPRGAPNGLGVVLLHGGAGFEMNAILFDAHAIQLASRGYWVVLPAYFDAARPDPTRRTVVARAWRQAALDARSELAARAELSVDRVALWGYSRGAGVAVDAAGVPGSGVRAAVLAAGGGSVDDDAEVAELAALLLHARRDEAVPVRATQALADQLRTAGATVEVQALEFDGHQYDLPTWCSVFAATRAFLERRPEGAHAPA